MNYPNNNQLDNMNGWDDMELEYFNDFSWDDKRAYFDDFKWGEDYIQEAEDNLDEQCEENFDDEFEELDNVINENENIDFIDDIENHNETHDTSKNIHREVYVSRMHNVIKQLKILAAEDVEIGTEQQGTILQSRVVDINDNIVTVRTAFKEITLPINQIVGVYSRKLLGVNFSNESENEINVRYYYDDSPLRELLLNHIGEEYIVNTVARDEVFNRIQGSVTKVEEGILIISNTVAVSIGKIISLERDIRHLYRNIDENLK